MKTLIESQSTVTELVSYLLEDYDFCSLQINLPPTDFESIWSGIDSEDLYEEEGKHYGLETEPHVTVLYGLLRDNPEEVKALVAGFDSFEVELAERSLFQNEKYDVLKYGVNSQHLHELNKIIRTALPYETNYPVYQPHCTLAYLKPGMGEKYLTEDELVGAKFRVSELLFSSRDRTKTRIPL